MQERVAVVGAGLIGKAWAIVFARAGLAVALHDSDPDALARARDGIAAALGDMRAAGLVDEPDAIAARVLPAESLAEALRDVTYVQECGPEDVGRKRDLFAQLERHGAPEAIFASSTSGIVASAFARDLERPERALVAHPVNPPHLVPVVEVVPGPRTSGDAVERTVALMERVGQVPVRVAREVDGFVLNRLQGALLNEALRLYRDGYASAEDIDRTIREGLGRRWAFMGPMETIDLNAPGGIADYARRYGPIYSGLDAERQGDPDPWQPEVIDRLAAEMRASRPLDALPSRHVWRDRRLMSLAAHLAAAEEK